MEAKVKISVIYDQGSSHFREDGFVLTKNIFGVLDGVSAPYSPNHPPKKFFNGLSGGEMIVRLVEEFFSGTAILGKYGAIDMPSNISKERLLEEIVAVNQLILEETEIALGTDISIGELPGATFAFAQVEKYITVVQGGDCMAVIELRSGDIVVTPNQVRGHDQEMNSKIEQIQRKIACDLFKLPLEEIPEDKRSQVRNRMWDIMYEVLVKARNEDVNNPKSPRGYALLNGQPQLRKMMWKRVFPAREVKNILLFSGGIVPWSIMAKKDDNEIGQEVLKEFKSKGLAGLLISARHTEEKNASVNYTNQAEATAIALCLDEDI
jgi:hypothetical protein